MWIRNNDYFNDNQVNIMAGKILVLCQKFEFELKNIVKYLVTTDNLIKKNYDWYSNEYKNEFNKLDGLLLGWSIDKLKKQFHGNISDEAIETLNEAKDSRNFLMHESLIDYIAYSLYSKQNQHNNNIETILPYVQAVAKGDFIVTSWNFEFVEREPQNFKTEDAYVHEIVQWIFSDID